MKVALITGGSRGIGLAMAKAFAGAGYGVIVTGRDEARLKKAITELKGSAGSVEGLNCDVSDPASIQKLFQAVCESHSSIDVLVNNAGVAHELLSVDKLPLEIWKQVIDTNLTGTFLVTQAALPLMKAGSTIVNNLSVAALCRDVCLQRFKIRSTGFHQSVAGRGAQAGNSRAGADCRSNGHGYLEAVLAGCAAGKDDDR